MSVTHTRCCCLQVPLTLTILVISSEVVSRPETVGVRFFFFLSHLLSLHETISLSSLPLALPRPETVPLSLQLVLSLPDSS